MVVESSNDCLTSLEAQRSDNLASKVVTGIKTCSAVGLKDIYASHLPVNVVLPVKWHQNRDYSKRLYKIDVPVMSQTVSKANSVPISALKLAT
jgi:hypothetical protein